MIILGIETSCDETAIAIVKSTDSGIEILSNIVSSQIELHAKWGGVVPNLAAREHTKNMIPVLREALEEANLTQKDIDLISVTEGPGLIPALLVGTNTAKTLSYLWKKPLLGIHHIEGHIYANFINAKGKEKAEFPILCLVVSGGHTQLVLMRNHLKYEIIGQTQDDAVGEAFDKVARILNLGYPGGPAISAKADEVKSSDPKLEVQLPRPMLHSDDFNFSFSGLKTAVLYETKKNTDLLEKKEYVRAISKEFQQAVIDVFIKKTLKASRKHNPRTIMLAGGVSANKELRTQLGDIIKKELRGVSYLLPDPSYSLDNAAMIAVAANFRWEKMSGKEKEKSKKKWRTLEADANLKLS